MTALLTVNKSDLLGSSLCRDAFCPDQTCVPMSLVSCSSAISAVNRMAKSETEEMIEIEIDERDKQTCLEEG